MGKEQFAPRLAEQGISLAPSQLEQFNTYYRLLVEWNERMNLTAITAEDEVYLKHFYDSITAAFYFSFANVTTVADIGAGAGFPSLPLKICFPHLRVTIVDSLQKRIGFLEHLAKELGLDGVTMVHARAEDAGQNPQLRESFDLVTGRAVARLNILAEYCLPFVRVDGHFLAMKGANVSLEMNEAKKAIKTLGGKTVKVESFELPDDAGERNIIIIEKVASTAKTYPRKAGIPAKKPLC
ncbi:16S rRNA (guanine(527)-N(7))-methyltransferase RsmG [Brevibacillus humidisoli]|uniref:16S rRNA (guanine(527)-N(7))-methyltransferase RsmG n=1 Tax=Brevibacillus humidisoli TaxID=2895522 RepID=UPI001E509DEF|nr:16S rRNA (guanine(527)-N(7))-methyltransferase RsmG [Brevibacillus humidisoli]UFJ40442.1 16S rRNA (guanine(527)-N(7))-methyltransferase RsmG [Brevibacillus humidisoli]